MRKNFLFFLFVAAVGFVSLVLPAMAQMRVQETYETSLTPNNIQAFLEHTDALAGGQVPNVTADDLAVYFSHHIADAGNFRTITMMFAPGQQPRTEPMKLDKAGFIANMQKSLGALKDYKTSIKIKDMKISPDGKSAVLSTVSEEEGVMSAPDGKGSQQDMSVKGESVCEQKLVLSPQQFIQMLDADCQTKIYLSDK